MLANAKSLDATLHSLIKLIYEATLDDDAFSEFMRELALATDSHFAGIEIVDPNTSNLCKWQAAGAYGLPTETVSEFNEIYGPYNPFVNLAAQTATEGSIFTDSDVLERKQLINMLYYDEFLRHYDFEHVSGMYVIHSPEFSVIASTSKGKSAGHFSQEERELFKLILPHLQKFFRIKRHIESTNVERDAGWDALNQLPHGVVIVDNFCNILFSNGSGKQSIAEADGLCISNLRLTAENSAANFLLSKALNSAIESYNQLEDFKGNYDVVVPRLSSKRPYHLQILPLRHSRQLYLPSGPAALVFIFDPEQGLKESVETLMLKYGLTKSEAKVASLIAGGNSLESIATAQKHSLATTRTILKRVFSKTDTHRQNELASLLLNGLRPQ